MRIPPIWSTVNVRFGEIRCAVAPLPLKRDRGHRFGVSDFATVASGGFVRDPVIAVVNLAAACMNVRSYRRAAAWISTDLHPANP